MNQLGLNFDLIETVLGKGSFLEGPPSWLPSFQTEAEVFSFFEAYGYPSQDPIQQAELLGHYREALEFIRHVFLFPDNPEGLKLQIPSFFSTLTDISALFLQKTPVEKLWAASIFKVMHGLAYIDQDWSNPFFHDIQSQILQRFLPHLQQTDQALPFLGTSLSDPQGLLLTRFEIKPKKSRESLLLKMLHKPDYVTETIFDRVGLRFVTPTLWETLKVLQYLLDRHLLLPFQLKPSRTKNTLLSFEKWKGHYRSLIKKQEKNRLSEADFFKHLEQWTSEPEGGPSSNPHSSGFYRSLQFTSHCPIHLEQPFGMRFFYPFEIQILDAHNDMESREGLSAHASYRKAQIATAQQKVFGPLLKERF